jgi:hypothetical protein
MTSTFFLTLHKTIGLLPRSKVPDDDRHKQAHKQKQNSSVGCSVKKKKKSYSSDEEPEDDYMCTTEESQQKRTKYAYITKK